MNKFDKLYKSMINEDNDLSTKSLNIQINLDNAAFTCEDEEDTECRNIEIIRILEKIVSDIENGKKIEDNNWPLVDSNGNVVGYLEYNEK